MNIQVDGHTINRFFGTYSVSIGKARYSTNNFELMLNWVAREVKELEQEERFKRALEAMPEAEYQELIGKPCDSENEDYTSEVHREEQLIKYEI